MIAKKVALKNPQKSSCKRLTQYLTNDKNQNVRVAEAWTVNCISDEPRIAAYDIINKQLMNTRSKADKTYHLLISFPAGERPALGQLKKIEQAFCEKLGYGEHQRIAVAHDDTDNFHLHVAINKIHPQRHTAHEPRADYKILSATCEALEKQHGLSVDNHDKKLSAGEGRAKDMERAGGLESFYTWLKERAPELSTTKKNWEELHKSFARYGVSIQKRGAGLVFVSKEADVAVQASKVDKSFAYKQMVATYGEYTPPPEALRGKTQDTYKRKPIVSSKLWGQYKAELEERKTVNRQIKGIYAKKAQAIKIIKDTAKKDRLMCKLLKGATKKVTLLMVRERVQAQMQEVTLKTQEEVAAIREANPYRNWMQWLKEKAPTDPEALAYLQARTAQTDRENEIKAKAEFANAHKLFQDGTITTKGSVILNNSVRLAKNSINIRNGNDYEVVEALRLAVSQYGNTLVINGNDKFRQQVATVAAQAGIKCTFTDPQLESFKCSQEIKQENVGIHLALKDADNYVKKRNEMRLKASGILEHVIYTPDVATIFKYAGLRAEGNAKLLLLQSSDKIYVRPVSAEEEKQILSVKYKVGTEVKLTAKGIEKTSPKRRTS